MRAAGSSRGDAERSLALVRAAALPVIFLGERIVDAPEETSGAFPIALGIAALYAAGALLLSYSRWRQLVAPATYVALDLLVIVALSLTSGGETSEVRRAFFLPPVAAAFLLGPGPTVMTSAATVVAYGFVALLDPPVGEFADTEFVLVQAAYIAWFGLAAAIFSFMLAGGSRRIEELAAERGRLVAQAIQAEEHERRRISEALHDEAVQNLLAARMDVADARRGDPGALDRVRDEIDRTLVQLRESVADLHPIALQQGGLASAVTAVAARNERRAGFRCSVRVDPEATGLCDELLLSLARELIVNAAKHAEASRVSVVIERRGPEVVLEVADDGRGLPEGRIAEALSEGHIGLAASAERARALGGSFDVSSEAGRGTVVRVSIPLAARQGVVAS